LTYDGAELLKSPRTCHVTCGIKIVDKRAIDPISKQLIVDSDIGFQSASLCYPICSFVGKETKENLHHYLHQIFRQFQEIGTIGMQQRNENDPNLCPMEVIGCCDMKSAWFLLKRGGGAKIHHFPCSWCLIHDKDLTSAKTNHDIVCRW